MTERSRGAGLLRKFFDRERVDVRGLVCKSPSGASCLRIIGAIHELGSAV